MNQALKDHSQEKSEPIDIKTEQLRVFFSALPASLATVLVNSCILSIIQWQHVDHTVIWSWLLFVNGFSIYRLWLGRRFEKINRRSRVQIEKWHNLAIFTTMLSGLSWGAAGLLLFPQGEFNHQVFLAFVLGGMCAGSITSLSAIPIAAVSFLVLTLLPLTVNLLLLPSHLSYPMAAMLLLFLGMLLLAVKRNHQTISECLTVRYQSDLTEQILQHQNLYDNLTKLPSRTLFLLSLDQEAIQAARHYRWGAVFVINFDRFSSIVESYGADAADRLLIKAAARIRTNLRNVGDTTARLGGDEFAALLPQVGATEELATQKAVHIANKIRRSFDKPLIDDEQEIHLTLSIGITLYPRRNTHAAELIQAADVAMYQAKNEGGNSVVLFSQPDT